MLIHPTGKKAIYLLLISLAFLIIGFIIFNSYIYIQKQSSLPPSPYQATLSGIYTCLPHKDKSGPQTLECAFGLQTKSGEYYALKNPNNQPISDFVSGQPATLTGTITPIETLQDQAFIQYDIQGVLAVHSTGVHTSPSPTNFPPDQTKDPDSNKPVFCTMDAKLCPDGSSVGRIPPNCNFAPCP